MAPSPLATYKNAPDSRDMASLITAASLINGDLSEIYVRLRPPLGSKPLDILYPRVCALGGCSQHKTLVTILPQDNDWDNIATITGDTSWGASKMREYYKKLEKCHYLPGGLDSSDREVLSLVLATATAMGKSLLSKVVSTVSGLLKILAVDINFDETGDRPKATGVEHLVGKSLHRADPRATKEESGIPGRVFASKGDLLGVGGNMRDRHEIGIVSKAPTGFSVLERWQTGTGGLKGGYTANGIAFGYFKHSSVAENGDPRLFLGGVRACFNGYFPNYAEHALADLSVWTWLTSRGHNASCTVPIGADNDPRAVLDSNFKVREIDGLRVVDASIFLKIPGFYIVLGIYMASVKAADVIIAEAQVSA
ncbi:choline dehydrogenase [Colletotrichum incanum]|nr:choline dehydrogenase [Colletotrichum incanum]